MMVVISTCWSKTSSVSISDNSRAWFGAGMMARLGAVFTVVVKEKTGAP
jgi:hypothetical protein